VAGRWRVRTTQARAGGVVLAGDALGLGSLPLCPCSWSSGGRACTLQGGRNGRRAPPPVYGGGEGRNENWEDLFCWDQEAPFIFATGRVESTAAAG